MVYLGCMASAVRVLRGPARLAAAPAAVIVAVVLAYCGWALLAALAVVLAVCAARPFVAAAARGRRPRFAKGANRAKERILAATWNVRP